MLDVCNWHNGMVIDESYFFAFSVFTPDIAISDCTFSGYPVFQPVVKALFDIIARRIRPRPAISCFMP